MKMARSMGPQMPYEGFHRATIKSIKEGKEANTKFGPSPTALITFITDNFSMATQSFLMAPEVNFQLENLAEVTIGLGENEEEVELEEVVGKRCGIEIKHRHVGRKIYANVIDVCAVEALQEEEEATARTHEMNLDEMDGLDD